MVSFDELKAGSEKIAVVGLGYVGLPLAVALGRKAKVVGLDVSERKVGELRQGVDSTGEVSGEELASTTVEYYTDPHCLAGARFIIVTVPTPIDSDKRPDLGYLEAASRTIGGHLQKGSIVVYESTVYPGATEEVCTPVLEEVSGLKCGTDFKVAYSPERINPGDKVHTIDKVIKVVAACDDETLDIVAKVYELVVEAGVHRAPTIKVAEAAKVIENTQRDLNIALMNELSVIFDKLGISTNDVLEAAGTKWNFLKFTPGLVGGHCIGVDPYYLTYRARLAGYHPEVILAGRRINDSMGSFIAKNAVKMMIGAGKAILGSRALVLGLTFKENVSDIRNTKVVDIVEELREFGVEVDVCDPLADAGDAREEYGLELTELEGAGDYDCVVLAVAHGEFDKLDLEGLKALFTGDGGVVVDVKARLDRAEIEEAGLAYWGL